MWQQLFSAFRITANRSHTSHKSQVLARGVASAAPARVSDKAQTLVNLSLMCGQPEPATSCETKWICYIHYMFTIYDCFFVLFIERASCEMSFHLGYCFYYYLYCLFLGESVLSVLLSGVWLSWIIQRWQTTLLVIS